MSPEKKAPAASASVGRAASRSAPKRAKSATGGTGAGPSPKAAGRSKAASASPAKEPAAVKEAPVKGAAARPPAPAPKAKASRKAPSAKSTAPKRAPAAPEKAPAAKPASKKPAAPPTKPAAPAKKAPAPKAAPKKPAAPAKKAPAPKKPAAPPAKKPAPPKKAAPAKEPVRPAPKAAAPAKPRGPVPSPFAVGDKVVYPHHGAAVIVRKERGEFQGQRTDYFVLEVATDQLTLKVPVPNALERGVRPVISRAMARKVLATFKEPPEEAGANWSRWYKLLTEKINSGDIFQVAEVVRDLTFAQQTKGISPALKRMLSKARLILASELRFALDVSEEESMRRLDKALPKLELVEEF
jgi:CarD family transcriptional regulator